ncbi:MAG: PAS domain S-box protein [Rhizobacter sp.]
MDITSTAAPTEPPAPGATAGVRGLQAMLDGLPDAFFMLDRSWRFTLVNHTTERLLGLPRERLLGQVAWELFPASRGGLSEREYRRAMDEHVPVAFEEYHAPLGIHVEVRAFPDENGIAVFVRDVTEQRRTMQHLHLLDMCAQNLSDVVMITDAMLDRPGPHIIFINAAAEAVTGYRVDELVGHSPRILQGPGTDPAALRTLRVALEARQRVSAELLNYRKDGSEFWVEMTISPVVDATGACTHYVAVQRDITERKQAEFTRRELEAQLRQAQKMESIGTLAGGIAHDFNNILSAVLANVEFARADLPPDSPALGPLGQIRHASVRARSLVQQILAFGRRQVQQLVERPLAPIVEAAVNLLRSTLPAGVRLELQLTPAPLLVTADATQLEQVVLNICTNAWHALGGDSGTISVGLDEAPPPSSTLEGRAANQPGRWAHLWISDTGSGMDEATQARIFEPFFTTKPVGQGTGLGLPVAHGIVTAHGGSMRVDSSPGHGTTFHVFLPARLGIADGDDPAVPGADAPVHGQAQRVVYIDDDEVVVLMAEQLLLRQGFQPTCFSSPREAVAAIATDPGRFDVVVTDFNMPEMSGADVTRAVKRLRPDLPVIITSGYLTDAQHALVRELGAIGPMSKQNSFEELGAWIVRATAPRG